MVLQICDGAFKEKKNHIEVIPENAKFEQLRSLGDELKSEDTGENGDNNDTSEQQREQPEQEKNSRKKESGSLEIQQSQL